jgi:DnaK suppressor protein
LLPTLSGDRPWTSAEVAHIRTSLETEATDLREEIAAASEAYDRNLHDSDAGPGDEADAGTATFEREHDLSLAANSRDLLAQVERALERLDAGTYGICEVCGNPIGKERLKAFPKVTMCVTCKQRENRR